MSSNCITETSKACFKPCCVNSVRGLPDVPLTYNSTTTPASPRQNFVTAILSSIQPNTYFTNHESLPSLTDMYSSLERALPHYSDTAIADDVRNLEYHNLVDHVCLDYIGNGLFSYSQIHGNDNQTAETASSSSSASYATFFSISYRSLNLNTYLLNGNQESELEASMRKRIMRYMNLFEEDYYLVFTANQSSALKLLADSYPFHSNQNLLTVYDYENESVQAMIESAREKGARPQSAVFSWPNFRVNYKKLRKVIMNKQQKNRGLFVFPLQSRMTGSRYSHQWMNLARDNGWHVLLDACALGAKDMETLGLSIFQPDFLISSFYKIFGENPSGFCCLFIKKSIFPELTNSSKSMGIISLVPATISFQKSSSFETESQTTSTSLKSQPKNEQTTEIQETDNRIEIKNKKPLHSEIEEVEQNPESTNKNQSSKLECRGLDQADKLGLILISSRTRCLINWLINALLTLKHPYSGNGLPLVKIYGPRIKLDRGPALAFNLYDWKGEKIDPNLVQKLADRNIISISSGFLKNLWFSKEFKEDEQQVLENRRNVRTERNKKWKKDCGIEVLSIFVGMLSNFEDVYRIWGFVARFLDADFVEKERWRYTALNQTPLEV